MSKPQTIGVRDVGLLCLAFVLLAAIALLDYFTGSDAQFYVFYYLPAGLLAWYFPVSYALILSLLGAFTMLWVDLLTGTVYAHEEIRYLNFGLQLISCMLASWATHTFRRVLMDQKFINEQLEIKKAELEHTIEQLNELRGGLQTVCAWTKRIKDEGKWVTLEEFMARRFEVQISHGMSDEAFEQFKRQMEILSEEKPAEPISVSSPAPTAKEVIPSKSAPRKTGSKSTRRR
jgi:hypothetical protein